MTAQAIFPSLQEEMAESVAMNIKHPWRVALADVTPAIVTGARIPDLSQSSKRIIGTLGTVLDSGDGTPLSMDGFTLEEIRSLNANLFPRLLPVYSYVIVRPRIFHTRPSVTIEVCVYDAAAQLANINNNGTPIFPNADGAYVSALAMKLIDPKSKFEVDEQGQIMAIIMGKMAA